MRLQIAGGLLNASRQTGNPGVAGGQGSDFSRLVIYD
jgi:hypothetical protein